MSMKQMAQFAIESYGMPEGWRVYRWNVEDPPDGCVEISGMLCPDKQRGPNKDRPNWKKPEPGTDKTIMFRMIEFEDWLIEWEKKTGACHRCEGSGEKWIGWNHETGNKYQTCERCGGSGNLKRRMKHESIQT